MAMIQRHETVEKVNQRIAVCRDAGFQVQQNFIAGTKEVTANNDIVLRCTRDGSGWLVEYNDQYWDEVAKEQPESQSGDRA